MNIETREQAFAKCEENGEAWARAIANDAAFNHNGRLFIMEWVNIRDQEQGKKRDEQAVRSIAAAEKSARWAMLAAISALLTVAISVIHGLGL